MKKNRGILFIVIFCLLATAHACRAEDFSGVSASSVSEDSGFISNGWTTAAQGMASVPAAQPDSLPADSLPEETVSEEVPIEAQPNTTGTTVLLPTIPELIQSLGSNDPAVVDGVTQTLIKEGTAAVPALTEELNNPNITGRLGAINILGDIGDPSAAPALISRLTAVSQNSGTARAVETLPLSIALGKIGDPSAIPAVFTALQSEENPEISRIETETLAILIEKSGTLPDFLMQNILSEDSTMRESIKTLLSRVDENQAITGLEAKKETETNPENLAYIESILQELRGEKETREKTHTETGIQIDSKFNAQETEKITKVLDSLPDIFKSGLQNINLNPFKKDDGDYKDGNKLIELKYYDTTNLYHEIGHFIDFKYYQSQAFSDLYNRSDQNNLADFARAYGKLNCREDFCTTLETYTQDTKSAFLDAIGRAESGNTLYLEKQLSLLGVFSKNDGNKATLFKGDCETFTADVVKDTTQPVIIEPPIISIGGVNIYNTDGTYNLEGLENYFENLVL